MGDAVLVSILPTAKDAFQALSRVPAQPRFTKSKNEPMGLQFHRATCGGRLAHASSGKRLVTPGNQKIIFGRKSSARLSQLSQPLFTSSKQLKLAIKLDKPGIAGIERVATGRVSLAAIN